MLRVDYNMLRLSAKWAINKDQRSIAIEQLEVFIPKVISVHKQTTLFLEPIYRQKIL